jgi:anti-anti-sigma regulatory factor
VADSIVHLPLTGALAVHRYPEFRSAFEQAPAELPVLIDLREATAVEPTFLAELLLFKRRRRLFAVAVLVEPDSQVARVLNLPGIKGKVAVYSSEFHALASLQREPRQRPDDETGNVAG